MQEVQTKQAEQNKSSGLKSAVRHVVTKVHEEEKERISELKDIARPAITKALDFAEVKRNRLLVATAWVGIELTPVITAYKIAATQAISAKIAEGYIVPMNTLNEFGVAVFSVVIPVWIASYYGILSGIQKAREHFSKPKS